MNTFGPDLDNPDFDIDPAAEAAAQHLADQNLGSIERPLPGFDPIGIEATPYIWRDPETIPPRPWVLGRWLLLCTAATVVAPGGVGKTTFVSTAALSMVTARNLLGKAVWGGPKRVWIWNLEDPLEELQRSLQASALHYGIERGDIAGRLFVDTAMEGKDLCTAVEGRDGFRVLAPIYEEITAEIKRREIDVLIIDPFVSSHGAEENDNNKIDAIAKAWARVANDARCVVVLVHHTSKAGAGDVTVLSARGAKALTDACRSALVLNRMDETTADRNGFDEKERRRYFSVSDDKHNRAPAESDTWFKLESVSLGNGGDSVGVAVPWKFPDPFEGLTVDHLYRVQRKIDDGDYRASDQSPDWAGNAVGEVLGLDPSVAKDKRRIKQVLKEWTAKRMFKEVMGKDSRSNDRKFLRVATWVNDLSSSPPKGEVRKGAEAGNNPVLTTTPHLIGGCGVGVTGGCNEVRTDEACAGCHGAGCEECG
jgi:hypothetical protein